MRDMRQQRIDPELLDRSIRAGHARGVVGTGAAPHLVVVSEESSHVGIECEAAGACAVVQVQVHPEVGFGV